jgi:peptidoglycan/xylan/chitin deacetylase (PgdA/CDA1 family)
MAAAAGRLGTVAQHLAAGRSSNSAALPAAAMPPPGARDFAGYGPARPDPAWPQPGATVALNFVLNIEEGSEPSVPDGDGLTESGLTETASDVPAGGRDLGAESMFEHGARVGFWRIVREFDRVGLPFTAMACPVALRRNPAAAQDIAARVAASKADVCAHGYRWENHFELAGEEAERERIRAALDELEEQTGAPGECSCRPSQCY